MVSPRRLPGLFAFLSLLIVGAALADDPLDLPKAVIDGVGPGWHELGEADFADVNGDPETWTFADGMIHGTGKPVGVMRTAKQYKNFEFVAQWKHLTSGGNSGFFVWCPAETLKDLAPNKLPRGGIEVQALDHGYAERYKEKTGKDGPYHFGTDGDVFNVGTSTFKPFPPLSPNGARSFAREKRSKGYGEWNHYYVRAINAELRLWVNGVEVSGGSDCTPAEGYLCLEAEGAPIDFRQIRVRELP